MKKIIYFIFTTIIFLFSFTNCNAQNWIDSLNINNIRADFSNDGRLFSHPSETTFYGVFEVPRGSGLKTLDQGGLWISGKDSNSILHLAGGDYGNGSIDFSPGPISQVYDSTYNSKYQRLWKINKSEIEFHTANFNLPGYIPSQIILDWPANGNTSLGQAKTLAPFFDINGDSIYNPYAGDFPMILGDQAVFFIINDDRSHIATTALKLGVEIHGMAYAFDCPSDSALWNTIFINYKLYNRSSFSYSDTRIGIYAGNVVNNMDDFIGSDVSRSSFYIYNGDSIDGITANSSNYGNYPPAQSITILAGPYLESDGNDNTIGGCDESINGFGFGDGTIDNERYGMTGFSYFNAEDFHYGLPAGTTGYDNILHGLWMNGIPLQWGGQGYLAAGACGQNCKFAFPDISDPMNWGTGCSVPTCQPIWNETTAGSIPRNRRGVGLSGSFTFNKEKVQELDVAFVFGRDYTITGNLAGIAVMQDRIDTVRKAFKNNITSCGESFSSINHPINNPINIKVYPNPTSEFIILEYTAQNESAKYNLFDIYGRLLLSGDLKTSISKISLKNLNLGIYLLRIIDGNSALTKKLIKN